jgi:CRISPR/Cas system CSM-associated protein Csm3 (group 7 of RAMP superfamily)
MESEPLGLASSGCQEAKELFGFVKIETANDKDDKDKEDERDETSAQNASALSRQQQSRLLFYDAKLIESSYAQTVRDGVRLDEYKTSKLEHKYDFEIIEPGAEFVAYIEAHDDEAARLMHELLSYEISFGAKTTRGYGRVQAVWRSKRFDLTKDEELDTWLEFDMFESSYDLSEPSSFNGKSYRKIEATIIKLGLSQKGALSIRQYFTGIKQPESEGGYDYQYMALTNDTPVIPGTSWAGLFRRNMADLIGCAINDDMLIEAMGWVEERRGTTAKAIKSKISFSESTITGGIPKLITHNAIDRYSGGVKDKALYTEKTVYNGRTSLEIRLEEGIEEKVKNALLASILDLHYGFIALGGATVTGKGLFKIDELFVDEEPLEIDFDSDPNEAFVTLYVKVGDSNERV